MSSGSTPLHFLPSPSSRRRPMRVTGYRCELRPSRALGGGHYRWQHQCLQRHQSFQRPYSCSHHQHSRLRQRHAATPAQAAVGQYSSPQPAEGLLSSCVRLAALLLSKTKALYQFSRPHTMAGTLVSVCCISLLAACIMTAEGRQFLHALKLFTAQYSSATEVGYCWASNTLTAEAGDALRLQGHGVYPSVRVAQALLQALVPALLMNICIVGINQLYDVAIDRVNKPYLPLASGALTTGEGVGIVLVTGAAAVALGLQAQSPPLLATLLGSLLLGIAYSTDLPLLRWKRHPAIAAACILTVRAVLVQLGFYQHMQLALGGSSTSIPPQLQYFTSIMLIISIVIALFKDVPDLAGDKKAGLQTLTVRLGVRRVFWICIGLLEAAYLAGWGLALWCTVRLSMTKLKKLITTHN